MSFGQFKPDPETKIQSDSPKKLVYREGKHVTIKNQSVIETHLPALKGKK